MNSLQKSLQGLTISGLKNKSTPSPGDFTSADVKKQAEVVSPESNSNSYHTSSEPPSDSYREAVKALEQLPKCLTPREKIGCLSESYGAMKSAVVHYHKG